MSGFKLIGPFEEYEVIVNNRRVPLLTGREADGGRILIVFEGRLAIDIDTPTAEQVVPFLADVIERCLDYKPAFNRIVEVESAE